MTEARPQVGTKYRGGSVIKKIDTEVSERPNGKIRTRYIMTMENGMMMMEDFFDEGKVIIEGEKFEEQKLEQVEFPQDLSASIKFAHNSHNSFVASNSNMNHSNNASSIASLSSSYDDDNILGDDDDGKKERKKGAKRVGGEW